jgi:dTDP-glucose 4,6-dehydratase
MHLGKNILITGGCGFIGSNFINYMVPKYQNRNFINLDAMYYCASLNNIDPEVQSSPNYKFVKGNICDYNLIVYLLQTEKIDTIIHFAAQSHVDTSFLQQSLDYTKDNVEGTHSLLEAVKNTDLNIFFLHISTDEVYGDGEHHSAKSETHVLCPTNPYAASKAGAEMLVNSYKYSFNLRTIITRGNNVYGPNQYPEKLIPKFIKLLENNEKCTIHGNGENLRSFIHVSDTVSAIETILLKGELGEIYNISSNHEDELTVMQVFKTLVDLIKGESENPEYVDYCEFVEDRPFNDKRYFISSEKLRKLGWEPKVSFKEGLKSLL